MIIGFIEKGKEGVHSLRRQLVVAVRNKECGAQTDHAGDNIPDVEKVHHIEGAEGQATLEGGTGGGG